MANRVESNIVVNIKAVIEGLPQVNALATGVKDLEKTTGTFSGKATVNLKSVEDGFGRLRTSAQGFAFSIDRAGRSIGDGFVPLGKAGADIKKFSDTVSASEDILSMRKVRAGIAAANEELDKSSKRALSNVNNLMSGFRRDDAAQKFQNTLRGIGVETVRASRFMQAFGVVSELALKPLAAIGNFVIGIFSTLVHQIEFLASAAIIAAATLPLIFTGKLIKEGVDFNAELEQARIGIAALIVESHELFIDGTKIVDPIQKFEEASAQADKTVRELAIASLNTNFTFRQLVDTYKQVLAPAAAAGIQQDQLAKVLHGLSVAASIVGVQFNRLGTEIRLLFAGAVRSTSRLGPELFGSAAAARAFIKEHKAAGDLVEALSKKLEVFEIAAAKNVHTWNALTTAVSTLISFLGAALTAGVFEKIKAAFAKIVSTFFDGGQLKAEFEKVIGFISQVLGDLADRALTLIGNVLDELDKIAKFLADNPDKIAQIGVDIENILGDLLNILLTLGGITVEIASTVGDTDRVRAQTANWHTILGYIAITLGIVGDAINLIIGLVETTVGAFLSGLATLIKWELRLAEILGYLNIIPGAAAEARKALEGVERGAADFAVAGQDRVTRALSGQFTNDAVERFLNGGAALKKLDKKPTPTARGQFKIDPSFREGDTDKAGKGAQRLSNRLAELQKQTTDLVRHTVELTRTLVVARIESVRAVIDQQFQLFASANKNETENLRSSLDHRLVSVEEYYKEKKRLEDAAHEATKQHLKDELDLDLQKFDKQKDAINDKSDAQISGIQAEAKKKPTSAPIQNEFLAQIGEVNLQRTLQLQEKDEEIRRRKVKLETDLGLLEQTNGQRQTKDLQDQADAFESMARASQEIQSSLLEASGRSADAEIRRIALQNVDQIKNFIANDAGIVKDKAKEIVEDIASVGSVTANELRALMAQAGVELDTLSPKLKALLTLMDRLENNARFQGLQQATSVIGQNLDTARAEVQRQIALHTITEEDGRKRIRELERGSKVELEAVLEKQRAILATLDPTTFAYAQMKAQIDQMAQSTKALGQNTESYRIKVADVLTSDINSFFDTILEGNQSILDSVRQLASGILKDIARVIIQALIAKAVLSAIGLAGGGSVGSASTGGAPSHTDIPHFADGGGADITGDGAISGPGTGTSDSILAWISNGEWIVPARRVAQYGTNFMRSLTNGTFGRALHFAAGGGAGDVPAAAGSNFSVKNINLFDPELLTGHLNTSHGERALLNVVSRNPDKFKRALGL